MGNSIFNVDNGMLRWQTLARSTYSAIGRGKWLLLLLAELSCDQNSLTYYYYRLWLLNQVICMDQHTGMQKFQLNKMIRYVGLITRGLT